MSGGCCQWVDSLHPGGGTGSTYHVLCSLLCEIGRIVHHGGPLSRYVRVTAHIHMIHNPPTTLTAMLGGGEKYGFCLSNLDQPGSYIIYIWANSRASLSCSPICGSFPDHTSSLPICIHIIVFPSSVCRWEGNCHDLYHDICIYQLMYAS